jgi:hypothetical protein
MTITMGDTYIVTHNNLKKTIDSNSTTNKMLGRLALTLMFVASVTFARPVPAGENDYTPYQCVFSNWDQQSCKVLSHDFPAMNIRANHCQQRTIENDPQKSMWCSVVEQETNQIYNEYNDCLSDDGFLDKTQRHCRLPCEGNPSQLGCDKPFVMSTEIELDGISGRFNVDDHMIKPDNVNSYTGEIEFGTDGLFRVPLHISTVNIAGENLRNKFSGIGGCIGATIYTYDEAGGKIGSIGVPQSSSCIGVINVWSPSISFKFSMGKDVFESATFIGMGLMDNPGYFQTPREVVMDKLTVTFVR